MVIEGQCLALFILAALSSVSMAGENKFLPPVNSSCACPNQVLTFECTVVGSGATVWTGSAFSCHSDTNRNEITLRHNSFTGGTTDECNGGAIIAESLHVIDDCFTSQLRVNVSNELNNKTVDCIHSTNTETVGQSSIFVTVISDLVPSGVQLTDVDQGQLTFTWYALSYNCSSLNYLASSNCTTWSCAVNTDTTTANCSSLQLPSVCTFRVTLQTEVCGQMGSPSEPITVTLRVPDKLMLDVIPVYSAESQNLLQIKANIQQQASFNITDTVSGSTTKYSSTFSSDNPLTMSINRNTSCLESTCAYLIDVPSDLCQSSSDISVAFSASNRLGKGPTTDSTTIGCTNQFVQVEYDRTMSTITCRFLNETDTSVKSCNVTYGQCGKELIQPRQLGNHSTMGAPNIVYIKFPVDAASLECYNVTASSDVFTVIIQAMDSGEEKGTDEVTVIAVTTVVLLFAIIVVIVIVSVIMVYIWIRRKKMSNVLFVDETHFGSDEIEQISMEDLGSDSKKVIDIDNLDLQRIDRGVYMPEHNHRVSRDCELRDFVKNELKQEYMRGCAFYEFVHDFEDISEDKQLIFKDEGHNELLSPNVDTKSNPLIGSKIAKPDNEDFQVFVQSTGSGARHLPAGSMLLYKLSDKQSKQELPLKLIISSHLKMKTLPNDVKFKKLCEKNTYCIFLELGTFEKTSEVIDVIWQDKKAEAQLYTGPSARKMVKDHYKAGGSEGFDKDKWRVFVLCKFDGNIDLKSGTNILQYEIPQISIDDFHVLTADDHEGCSSLSKFVEQKLKNVDGTVPTEFINGHSFYEFKREEDLQYYKEVIFWETKTNQLTSSIDLFYGLPGVPAVGVKPPRKEGVRVFIQSTSQGARCVKPGDTILYKRKQVESKLAEP